MRELSKFLHLGSKVVCLDLAKAFITAQSNNNVFTKLIISPPFAFSTIEFLERFFFLFQGDTYIYMGVSLHTEIIPNSQC